MQSKFCRRFMQMRFFYNSIFNSSCAKNLACKALCLACFQFALRPCSADSSADYFEAYNIYTEAKQLAEYGNFKAAERQGALALHKFNQIARQNPDWKRDMLNWRRKELIKSLESWKKNAPTVSSGEFNGKASNTKLAPATSQSKIVNNGKNRIESSQVSVDKALSEIAALEKRRLFELDRYRSENETLRAQNKNSTTRLQSLVAENTYINKQLDALQKQLRSKNTELLKVKSQSDENTARLNEKLAQQVADFRQQIKELTREHAEKSKILENKLSTLTKNNAEQVATLNLLHDEKMNTAIEKHEREFEKYKASRQNDISRLLNENAEIINKLQKSQTESLSAAKEEKEALRERIATMQKYVEDAKDVSQILTKKNLQIKTLRKERDQYREIASNKLSSTDNLLVRENASLKKQLEETESKLAALEIKNNELVNQNKNLSASLQKLEVDKDKLAIAYAALEKNNALLKQKNIELQVNNENLTRERKIWENKTLELTRQLEEAQAKLVKAELETKSQSEKIADIEKKLLAKENELKTYAQNAKENNAQAAESSEIELLQGLVRKQLTKHWLRKRKQESLLKLLQQKQISVKELETSLAKLVKESDIHFRQARNLAAVEDPEILDTFPESGHIQGAITVRSSGRNKADIEERTKKTENVAKKESNTKSSQSAQSTEIKKQIVETKLNPAALIKAGEHEKARTILRKTLANNPRDLNSLLLMGRSHFGEKNKKDKIIAEEFFTKAAALPTAKKSEYAHYMLGRTKLTLNKLEEARTNFEKCLQISPNSANANYCLAVAEHKLGENDSAELHFLKALDLNPNLRSAHLYLAYIYALRKDEEREQDMSNGELARKHYKQAIRLGSSPNKEVESLIGEGI